MNTEREIRVKKQYCEEVGEYLNRVSLCRFYCFLVFCPWLRLELRSNKSGQGERGHSVPYGLSVSL